MDTHTQKLVQETTQQTHTHIYIYIIKHDNSQSKAENNLPAM